jgi:hypothetical protein
LASSSIRLIVRSRSKVFLQMVQVYSYKGICVGLQSWFGVPVL